MIGRVVSTKSQKTATVLVERVAMHPLYKKTFIRSKSYLVDDKIGVKEGDVVEIIKCKPVSKNKHWMISKVIGKNLAEIAEEKLKKEAEEVIAEVMLEEKEEVSKKQGLSKITKSDNSTKKAKSKKKGGTELSK